MSDAMTIAKYVMPERSWNESFRKVAVYWLNTETDTTTAWSTESWYDVHYAEQHLLAQGHGEAYGNELFYQLFPGGLYERKDADGGLYAALATAPVRVRCQALAAVIRTLQGEEAEEEAEVAAAPEPAPSDDPRSRSPFGAVDRGTS